MSTVPTTIEEAAAACRAAWEDHPEAAWEWNSRIYPPALSHIYGPAKDTISHICAPYNIEAHGVSWAVKDLNGFRPASPGVPPKAVIKAWSVMEEAYTARNKAHEDARMACEVAYSEEYYEAEAAGRKVREPFEFIRTPEADELLYAGTQAALLEEEYHKARGVYDREMDDFLSSPKGIKARQKDAPLSIFPEGGV